MRLVSELALVRLARAARHPRLLAQRFVGEVFAPEPEPLESPDIVERPVDVGAGVIDFPVDGTTTSSTLIRAHGWLRPELGYDRLELRLGDRPAQRARLMSEPRSDLAALTDEPGGALAGWEELVDLSPSDEARTETLSVEAVGPAGRFCLGERRITIGPLASRPVDEPRRLAVLAARADSVVTTAVPPRHDGVHLFVATHHLGLGGGQLYLHEMLRHVLAAEDVSCTVLSSVDGVLRDELEAWGARVHIMGYPPLDGIAYETRMLELASLVAAAGANVALANTTGSFWGVDLAHRLGLPTVWAIHESFTVDHFVEAAYPQRPDDHVMARLRGALASANAVVFEADTTRHLYERDVGPHRSIRVDYGIDLERIDHYVADHDRALVRADHGVSATDRLLVCVGTFEPRKSQAALALAFGRVVAAHPDAVLALVGDTGTSYAHAVRDVVDRLALGDRIRLIPVVPDVDEWYLMADGFVLASDVESLPRSILEVMAFGVPVIASSVFGVPEVITDGDNGLLFEARCLSSLTAALDRFLSLTPDERTDIGARGQRCMQETRSSKFYADAYRQLFDALCDDAATLPGEALARS